MKKVLVLMLFLALSISLCTPAFAASTISIYVDGAPLRLDVSPEARNGRTMVPIRVVAETLGADVEWVAETQQIIMTRAGSTVTMTLNSTTALVDGKTVVMDVAPYATEGRTLIPARYVAEFFGQTVAWDGVQNRVDIQENTAVAEDSNLAAWAMAMGAMRNRLDRLFPQRFGGTNRNTSTAKTFQAKLASDWGIKSRAELISTVQQMTGHGHNDDFQEAAAIIAGFTDAEFKALIEQSKGADIYMWPYTKALAEKWGDKGILAWDLSRMSNLVQWGYIAGYLTYAETLELFQPAAELAEKNFVSWEEFYENYLDGYNWWARNDVADKPVWEATRGPGCRTMLEDTQLITIFDNSLFKNGIIGLPK